jgi:hypothetical protein
MLVSWGERERRWRGVDVIRREKGDAQSAENRSP